MIDQKKQIEKMSAEIVHLKAQIKQKDSMIKLLKESFDQLQDALLEKVKDNAKNR